MLNEKRFPRQIEDFAWYEFINKLEYKANWYGKKNNQDQYLLS